MRHGKRGSAGRLPALLPMSCRRDLPNVSPKARSTSRPRPMSMRVDDSAPLVSVIMPTYNRAAVIGKAIQSVIEQRYPHWELLVCDDGGNDHTENVVERFADPRIRYLKLPRGGAAKARNAGLRQARAAIFAYLDSDNIWHPLFLSVVVATFQNNAGRSALYCDFIDFHVDERGQHKILSLRARRTITNGCSTRISLISTPSLIVGSSTTASGVLTNG